MADIPEARERRTRLWPLATEGDDSLEGDGAEPPSFWQQWNSIYPEPAAEPGHNCRHCLALMISPQSRDVRKVGRDWSRTWKWRLPCSIEDVFEAADSGCPFFEWLWSRIVESGTTTAQLSRTNVSMEFTSHEDNLGDIFHAKINLETDFYSWTAGSFDVTQNGECGGSRVPPETFPRLW